MFTYYLTLALRSLRRNVVLTVLMIAAIGVGIGASMTTLTVFRAMAGDPIPRKSRQLFAAVSYTHLDVYKRQARGAAPATAAMACRS